MTNNTNLSEVWLKASVLGASWAASEIILGSFLHNLHVPFKGNILTAIGVILLISASFQWKDKGLFWRSGLICALMKTMSPSAVIFGPMVAIFMEAVLFEASVRLFGRRALGFAVGSALAMSWVLVQKIVNLIIFYGFNVVEVYSGLLKFIQKQLGITSEIFWQPLLFLLGIYIIFGLFAAFIGFKIGKQTIIDKNEFKPADLKDIETKTIDKGKFEYSISWLVISLLAIIAGLFALNLWPLYVWLPLSVTTIMVWIIRYKRAMRQLVRPKFLISFILITVLAAVAITYLNGSKNALKEGLMIGVEMNVRAAIVILGFTVLGTELYNPKIRNYLGKSSFHNISAASELAFESLPFIIAHLPEARTYFVKPAEVIKTLLFAAEKRLNELKNQMRGHVFIVTGGIAEGKTSFLINLANELKELGFSLGGFYAPRTLAFEKTMGYSIMSVETGEEFGFLKLKTAENKDGIGRFEIEQGGLEFGKRLLSPLFAKNNQVIIIDEIGNLELNDGGWKESLEKLLEQSVLCIILSVRSTFVDQVIEKFSLQGCSYFPVSKTSISSAMEVICSRVGH